MIDHSTYITASDIIKNKTSDTPSAAVININSICNLRCEFCWIHSPLNKKRSVKQTIPLASIKKNIDQLNNLGVKFISLSGDGEPWMHPYICEIIGYIQNRKINFRITTNFTFKKEKIRLAFAKANLIDINFSAPTPRLYQKIHSPQNNNSYINVLKNLKIYTELYRKKQFPLLEINYIITASNYLYIDDMLKLADDFGIPNIRFRILDVTKYTKKLLLGRNEIISFKAIIKKIFKKKYKVKNNLTAIYRYLGKNGSINFMLDRCFIGWMKISLECNGNIGFCCQNDKLIIGNWERDSIKSSWLSRKASLLRLKAKNEFDLKKSFWQNCIFCCDEERNKKIDLLLKKFSR